jgi:hypothetical protein
MLDLTLRLSADHQTISVFENGGNGEKEDVRHHCPPAGQEAPARMPPSNSLQRP